MARAINPTLVDDLYTIPEFEYWARIIRDILKQSDPVEILRLNDHNLQIGFTMKGTRVSTYMYGSYGEPGVENFINSVYLMFKSQAPKELDYQTNMRPVLESTAAIGRYISRKGMMRGHDETEFEAKFDFEKRIVRIDPDAIDSPSGDGVAIVSFEDLRWATNLPIIATSAEKVKARATFVKRRIDEIIRNRRHSRGTGGDILAL
jgi:hypothetical protein